MNSSTIKLLVSGMLLLLLGACAPYPHTYYSTGGSYGGYGVIQRNYYGGYPYRYNNHSYPYNNNYRYYYNDNRHYHPDRYGVYNSRPSWNNSYVRPNTSNNYSRNHPDRKHQQFDYQRSIPAYPNQKDRHNLHGNNNWNKPSSDRSWGHNKPQHGRSNMTGQNYGRSQRSDDRRNQIKDQRHYNHENNRRAR